MTQSICLSFLTESISVRPTTNGRRILNIDSTKYHARGPFGACEALRIDQSQRAANDHTIPQAFPSLQLPKPLNIQPRSIAPAMIRLYWPSGTDHCHRASGLMTAKQR